MTKGQVPEGHIGQGRSRQRCCQHLEKKWWHVEQRQDGRPLGQLGGASPELPMRLRRLCQSLSTVGGLTSHALVKGEVLKAKGWGVVSATSEPPWQVSKPLWTSAENQGVVYNKNSYCEEPRTQQVWKRFMMSVNREGTKQMLLLSVVQRTDTPSSSWHRVFTQLTLCLQNRWLAVNLSLTLIPDVL